MRKIRCSECGAVIAMENNTADGKTITVMCNNRKYNGTRCKTVNVISTQTEERGK